MTNSGKVDIQQIVGQAVKSRSNVAKPYTAMEDAMTRHFPENVYMLNNGNFVMEMFRSSRTTI